jgi:hypothetical protein
MTRVIIAKNVNHALGDGFQWLKVAGVDEESRAGPVRVAQGPVITEYLYPTQRVLFNAKRDANPVFHLLESIWMLAGGSNSSFLLPYNARMAEYSEPDGKIHGAYGYRWRQAFALDQITEIVGELRRNPDSRQCVMQMWSAELDLAISKKDRPCNTHIYFDCRRNAFGHRVLGMTVCCRSNDALWGAYGANAVHFSILQELMAAAIGVGVGTYRQVSNNFHAYKEVPCAKDFLENPPVIDEYWRYPRFTVPLLAVGENYLDFLTDCEDMALGKFSIPWKTNFFRTVVSPLKTTYDARKAGSRVWKETMNDIVECDWKLAFTEWTERREHSVSK